MNRLDEMIEKLCPNGIEYKRLQSICNVTIGEFVHKNNQRSDAKYPVFNGGTTNTGFYDAYNNEGKKILISARGANAGFVNKIKGKYWAGNSCYSISVLDENKVNWLYIYYFMKNNQARLLGKQQTGSIPAIAKKQIEEFKVDLPPLEIQCKIVHILDNFTGVSSELLEKLSVELKARQKQYEYYKNKLYSFDNEAVKYEKLGRIAKIYRGGNFQKKDFVEKGKPCIHYGQIYSKYGTITEKTLTFLKEDTFNKSKKAQKDDIIMAVTSENIEDVCKCVVWHGKEEIAVSGHTAIIHHTINTKYLGYYFSTIHFFKQKEKLAHGTKVIEVTPNSLNDIVIPIPPLEIQEEIVNILEKFDKLCNEIAEELSIEMKVRHEQYEYYRDKLLTFNRRK